MLFFCERYAKNKDDKGEIVWAGAIGLLVPEVLEKIGIGLIVAIVVAIVVAIRKFCWSWLKKIDTNKLLSIFFPETKKKLEGIIASDESDIDASDIEWFRKKRLLHKKFITEELNKIVQNTNSKENTKEIKALILLSHILSAKKSYKILENIIKDRNIKWKISNAAVISLENILSREDLEDTEKDIKKLLFEELSLEKHSDTTIECLKYFQDNKTLLKLMEKIIDGANRISERAISSIKSICDERKEGLPRFFYHYAELVLLIGENQKIFNSIIVILKSQKNRRADILINKIINRGRFSEYGEKSDWVETNEILTKTGD